MNTKMCPIYYKRLVYAALSDKIFVELKLNFMQIHVLGQFYTFYILSCIMHINDCFIFASVTGVLVHWALGMHGNKNIRLRIETTEQKYLSPLKICWI